MKEFVSGDSRIIADVVSSAPRPRQVGLAGRQSVAGAGDVRIDPPAFGVLTDYSLPALTTTGSFTTLP